ncbi:MAG TPA: SPOR domain-containing protein [Methyloceanibacter sp.]|jgi:hypothetical protein|nr:SPOR domain-containing protein [Methyloceanibacter sp.]
MRSWVPGLFATFWILLAAFSAAYLFRIVTEPHAGQETAQAEPVAVQAPPPLSVEQASALISGNEAKDREIAELRSQVGLLSQQMTELNTRLQPLEKVLGPVAALPSGGAVTTSPPSPGAEVLATPPPEPKPPAKLSKQEAAKQEAAKKEAAKQEAAKQEAAKQEAAKQEAAKQEAAKQEAAKQEAAKQEAAKQEAAKQEAAKQEAAKQEAAKQEAAKQEAAKEAEKPAEPATPSATSTPSDTTTPPSTQVASANQTSGGTETPSSSAAAPSDTSGSASSTTEAPAPVETANLSGSAIPIPPGTTRFGIEIGGADKQDGLRPLWKDLISNHAALVAGLQAKRVLAPDKKWRLVAGPFANVDEATQACGLFKKADLPCEATVFAGDAF